jgi:hypothetical protein
MAIHPPHPPRPNLVKALGPAVLAGWLGAGPARAQLVDPQSPVGQGQPGAAIPLEALGDGAGPDPGSDLDRFQEDPAEPRGDPPRDSAATVPETKEAPPDPDPAAAPLGPVLPDAGRPAPAFHRADLSHFFARNLPLGTIRELAVEDLDGTPKRLVAMDGGIGWSNLRSDRLTYVSPRGMCHVALGDEPIDIGWLATEGSVWYTSHGGTRFNLLPLPRPARRASVFASLGHSWTLPAGGDCASPGSVVRAGDGMFWRLRQDGAVDTFLLRPPALVFQRRLVLTGKPVKGLAAGTGSQVLGLTGNRLALLAHTPSGADLYPAIGARKAFLGRDPAIWYHAPGPCVLGRIDATGSHGGAARARIDDVRRWSLKAGKIQVLDLAEGPDRGLWFTAANINAIGRIDLASGIQSWFPLPLPNSLPARIIPGQDGKMYFTELGAKRIGAITAAEPSADWLEPLPRAGQAAPLRWQRKRTARAARGAPDPGPSPRELPPDPPAPIQPPEPEPRPAAGPAAPPAAVPRPPSRDYQAALRVAGITSIHWDHIRREHHYLASDRKGEFTRSRSSEPALAELIYHCLTDPICDPILSYDGNWLAMRRFAQVIGYYRDAGPPYRRRPTDNLVVVLSPDQETVLTAYPVKPFWGTAGGGP